MAEGETATPILRPGVVSASSIPQAPPPGVPVVNARPPMDGYPQQQPPSATQGHIPQMMQGGLSPVRPNDQFQQQNINGMPNAGGGGNPFDPSLTQGPPMHQINLTSPPPVPTSMRNAEFY